MAVVPQVQSKGLPMDGTETEEQHRRFIEIRTAAWQKVKALEFYQAD